LLTAIIRLVARGGLLNLLDLVNFVDRVAVALPRGVFENRLKPLAGQVALEVVEAIIWANRARGEDVERSRILQGRIDRLVKRGRGRAELVLENLLRLNRVVTQNLDLPPNAPLDRYHRARLLLLDIIRQVVNAIGESIVAARPRQIAM